MQNYSGRKSRLKNILKVCAVVFGAIIALLGGFVIWLTANEYHPADIEKLEISGVSSSSLAPGSSFSVLSFNIGYGALDSSEDFFMDGGQTATIDSAGEVEENLRGIEAAIKNADADFIFLQEVDRNAKRSWGIDEAELLTSGFNGQWSFAVNFSAPFVPYPLHDMIGPVYGGLVSMSSHEITEATRISLPTPFSWPIRTCQLKRCLLVQRVDIKGTDVQLVLVNLHLEAYDNGEGKIAQTKILTDFLVSEYEKGNYVVAGGDFNQTFPGCEDVYPLKSSELWAPGQLETDILPNGWTFACDSSIPTCRLLDAPYDKNSTQHYVIDGFILSPNIIAENISTLDLGFEHADHNPVLANLRLGQ